jgi:deoxyribonuclease V
MLEKEAIEKGIDVEALKNEQKKLVKNVVLKDAFDFKFVQRYGSIITEIVGKSILAVCVVLNENLEVIEEKYAIQKIKFPYIPGLRAYRELPVMLEAYEKIEDQPDVIFILGHGISHPCGIGIASHVGVILNKPTIGISKNLVCGKEKEGTDNIVFGKKIVAKKLITREGSKPIYVSQGNMISLKTALTLVVKCLKEPHKLPEPIVLARKFASRIKEEIK